MTDFKILSYIKKWYIPIVLISVLCCLVFARYIDGKQTYTASVILSYRNEQAASGKTPTGVDIDVNEISASNIVADAINELQEDVSIDFVRSRIFLTEIIPEDEQTRKKALLENGEESTYFPTQYIVSFKVDSRYSEEFARRMLEAVMRHYIAHYGEKYVDVTLIPDNVSNSLNASFDYLESVELLDSGLNDIIDYLYMRSEAYPNFYGGTAGYSFGGMLDQYIELRELNVYKLYAEIFAQAATKNPDQLLKKYQYQLEETEKQKIAWQEKIEQVTTLIDAYIDKAAQNKVTLDGNATYVTSTPGAADVVTTFVSGTSSDKQTSYDEMITQRVEYRIHLGLCDKNINYYQYVIDAFSSPGETEGGKDKDAEILANIEQVTLESDRLYGSLKMLVNEFNEYNSTRNIATLSTISVSEGVNTTLYIVIAFILFILIGCFGAVAVGRIGEAIRRYMYVDKRTGLPNRLSCDKEIERLSKKPLGRNVTCVYISLDNLAEINEKQSHAQGDLLLKNFGVLLGSSGEAYGFVGYNGGQYFMCLFENCQYEKALEFENRLKKAISRYNESYPNMPLEISAAICESEKEEIYTIRALLKAAIAKLYVGRKGQNA